MTNLKQRIQGLLFATAILFMASLIFKMGHVKGHADGSKETDAYWTTAIVRRGYARWSVSKGEKTLEFRQVANYFPRAVVFRDEAGELIESKGDK